jgi:tripartite-type tricarboxylate transporter receptor subunit TctC
MWTLIVLLATATLLASPVHAQSNYPDRAVKIIVPFAPGGGADVMARLAAGPLALRLKQPFVVENRGGAGGNIGTAAVAQAAPDGYTLLLITPATTINHTLAVKPGYDLTRDFAPIASWSRSPLLFITAQDVPARNLMELANHVKANPGKLSYASGGVGLITHLVLEFFKSNAALDMVHVPFSGQAPALAALMGGQVTMTVDSIASSQSSVKAGRVRALATTGNERFAELKDVPTVAEAGFPHLVAYSWYGFAAPAQTPARVLDTLNAAMVESLRDVETQKKIEAIGAQPDPMSRDAYTKFIGEELARWAGVVMTAKLKQE